MRPGITRRGFLGLSLGSAAAFGLAACGGSGPQNRGSNASGLSVGMKAAITSLTPFGIQGYNWSQMMGLALYDTLVRKDESGKLVPAIAESFDTSDPKVTVLKIRKGVKFHDGTPMTAKDVAYSISARCDPEVIKQTTGRPVMSPTQFGKVEVVDDFTVKVHTNERVEFLVDPQPILIVPADSFGKVNFANQVVGTGPFKLANFVSGSRVDTVANPDYWGGKPPLDKLDFVLFADVATEGVSLRSNQVNALYDIAPLYLDQVKNVPGTRVVSAATYANWWIIQMGKEPLNDVRVRKALRYCFDTKQLNAASFKGLGKQTWNPFTLTPQTSGVNATDVTYDPERAKSMLAEIGKSGISVPLNAIQGYEDCAAQAQIIQQGLQAAGVKSEIKTLEANAWLEATYTKGTWEGLAFNAGNLPFPTKNLFDYMTNPSVMLSAYTNGQPPVPAAAELYRQVKTTPFDAPEAPGLLAKAEAALVDDALVYFMFGGPVSLILPEGLNGVESNGFGDVFWHKASF
ncbi:ABC transporter substrate-binding protein [Dactylosporangium sp. CA-233914]|uniref:ABC transporter substrate-binding protein n=1 Tax=Dactylosporangium sp. CA-233914 TaxID=3239934 RepID=UPI003D8DC604